MDIKDIYKIKETFTIQASPGQLSNVIQESADGEEYIMPRIEAIHAGATRNFNHYLAEKLKGDPVKKSGVYSFTNPYPIPMIYDHDVSSRATGRIVTAAYTDYTSAGKPGIIIVPKITDPEAIKAIKDGRLLTVSVGATTDSVTCSITGKNILEEGFTGYEKGKYYDGKLCEWIIGDIWFNEVSWVNVPADIDAKIIDTHSPIFVGGEQDKLDGPKESATRSLQEFFGISKAAPIFVPGLQEGMDIKNKIAEIEEQEESAGMDLTEQEVVETEEVKDDKLESETEVEVTEEETNEAEETKTEEVAEEESNEEVLEEEPAEESSERETETEEKPEPEDTPDSTKESTIIKQLTLENTALKTQVEELLKELKEHYISRIVSVKEFTGDKKDSYIQKLSNRTLESLKDTLSDIEEMEVVEKPVVVEKKVTTIKQPFPTQESVNESKKEPASIEDKVKAISALLKY